MEAFSRILVCLSVITLSSALSVEWCSIVVIKSKDVCTQQKNVTMGCCDAWCNTQCEFTTYYTTCVVQYFQVNECCEGYAGDNCEPECKEGCGFNGFCTSPDECTCMDGWSGKKCEQVSGLEVSDVTASSISLAWITPSNMSNINGYYTYIESDQLLVDNITVYDVVNETTFSDLFPFTNYKACVVPLVFEGNGTESCVLSVRTDEGVPTPPSNVAVSGVTETTLHITWTPPTQTNGIISHYTLSIYYSNSDTNEKVTVDGLLTAYLLGELVTNENIGVRISATTGGGESTFSSMVFNKSTDTPVQDITREDGALDSSVITATQFVWTEPSHSINNVWFYLLNISSLTQNSQWSFRPNQKFNYTWSLESYIPYKFELFVATSDGRFGLLDATTFFAQQGVPVTYPGNLMITRVASDSINLQWSPVSLIDARGFVTGYTVRYSKGTGSCVYMYDHRETTTQEESVQLGNIAVDSIYCISVAVTTVVGEGPHSPVMTVPLFEHSQFTLYIRDNCDEWTGNTTCSNSKRQALRRALITELNDNCACITSDSYFHEETFNCDQPGVVLYAFDIIGVTEAISSTKLTQVLRDRIGRNNTVVIQGSPFTLGETAGEVAGTTELPSCDNQDDESTIIVLGCFCGFFSIGWLITILYILISKFVLDHNKIGNESAEMSNGFGLTSKMI